MSSTNYFPRVDILATHQFAKLFTEAASSLGVEVNLLDKSLPTAELCSAAKGSTALAFINIPPTLALVNSLERDSIRCAPNAKLLSAISEKISRNKLDNSSAGKKVQVLVARSPHGQIASWAPSSIQAELAAQTVISPTPELSESEFELAQNFAINIAGEIGLIGVLNVGIAFLGNLPALIDLEYGPCRKGLWTLHGAITSQFEQHIRAILDLPLGDTSLRANWTVTGDIEVGSKQDMYRPYLHLMARTPELKFWQGLENSFMSISGNDLNYLKGEIEHARLYFKGVIDE